MDSTKPNIVIQTAFLGDLLLAIPLLRKAKELRPRSPLILVCRKGLGNLFLDLKIVDEVYEVEKNKSESYQAVAKKLKTVKFEWLICPHMSLRSAHLSLQLKANKKISFQQWWNAPIFNVRIQKNLKLPDALRQMSLLKGYDKSLKDQLAQYAKSIAAGTMGPVPAWSTMSLVDRIQQWPAAPFQFSRKYICLFPGSVWATKQWTEEGFQNLAANFKQDGFDVIWMGGPGEEKIGERLEKKVAGSINLISKTTVQQSLKILSNAQLVVANDSSGQHLAAVVDVPTISIFGPTHLKFGFRPWNSHAKVVENKDIDCRPCGAHGHQQCPKGHHRCMKTISANQVYRAAQEFVGN